VEAAHNHRLVAAEEGAHNHPQGVAVVVARIPRLAAVVAASIRPPAAGEEADCLPAAEAAAANQTLMSSLRSAGCAGTYLETTDDPRLNRERIGQCEHDSYNARDGSE
jgi:hypothetical protein